MSAEIKAQIDKIGEAWEASKKTNDELTAKLAKNEGGIAELKEKQDKIDAALDTALKMKSDLEKTMDAVKRFNNQMDKIEEKNDDTFKKAFESSLRKFAKSGSINMSMAGLNEIECKTMSTLIDPDGGYTVTNMLQGIKTRQFDTSPVRSVASVTTIGGSAYPFLIDDDEHNVSDTSELGSREETDAANFGFGEIQVHEKYALVPISQKLLEDSGIDLMSWSGEKALRKFERSEANDFVVGSGTLKSQGFTTATVKTSSPRAYARGEVGTLTAAGTAALTIDELITLEGYIKSYYRPNWAFNSLTRSYIRKLKDSEGNYHWEPSTQVGTPDMLLGHAVVVMEDMPDMAANAISVVLADFRECYQIVDRVGISLLDDPYTTKGVRKLYYRKRVGGGLVNWDGIKYIKQAAS
jgi:HK97 family phage major capsid protein